jgi:hypothetical protein
MQQIQRNTRTYAFFKATSTGSHSPQLCEILPVLRALPTITDHHQDLDKHVDKAATSVSLRPPLRQNATNLNDLPPKTTPSESDSDSSQTSDDSLTIMEKSYIVLR